MVRFTDMLRRIQAKGRVKPEADLLEEWIFGLIEKAPAEPDATATGETGATAPAAEAPAPASAPERGARGFVSLESRPVGERRDERPDRGERRDGDRGPRPEGER